MTLKVRKILVSQPRPAIIEKSPLHELALKYGVTLDYVPLIKVAGVTAKDFRSQRIDILSHTAVIFTSRTIVDSFFHICEESRITVPETMKYICTTEAIALYLQKYIVYRKRKISFADGSFNGLIELIVKHKEEKFLLGLSEPHKPELPETLERLKINFDRAILARTVAADTQGVNLSEYDMLLLYSPWDIKAIGQRLDPEHMPALATFGNGTLKAAIEAGLTVMAGAPMPGIPSMVKAVDLYLDNLAKGRPQQPVALVEDGKTEEFIRNQQNKLARKSKPKTAAAEDNKQ
ncbi:MAG: uroporphyrinogen-III synthase [Alistipes sp.]|nr:uroporphyrinogen-III synthase [Alistipes sp.]